VSNTDHPLRILQVSTVDCHGGAAGSAWNLFRAYRHRGLDSWLAVGQKLSDDPDVLVIPNQANRRARWVKFWRRVQAGGHGTWLRPIRSQMGRLAWLGEPRRRIERYFGIEDFNYPGTWHLLDLPPRRPTVVHCHNLHGNYFDLRALPWLSQQVPLILNLRDAWLLTGHCAYYCKSDSWKKGCGSCPDLTIYPAVRRDATDYNWRRKRDIYNRSRLYLTAPSQWLIDRAKESMLKGVQYRVIPNAIDLTIFKPGIRDEARRALQLPLKARIILLTAQTPFKDLTTMEAALGQISLDTKDDILFLCLGKDGVERILGQGIIRYSGYESDRQRMSWYYQAADIFLHAAHAEAFGKTLTEAMACGLPVVATAVGGIPEQIEDGVTGILVPPNHPERMSNAVELLLTNAELRNNMAASGIIHARDRFGLDRQVNDFLAWYEEVLADWSNG
jgi:glycosyltransferase involved in cell wall biosynthesis